MTIRCCNCGREVNMRTETVWNKVVGWEHQREQGGTNHIALRERLQEFMCAGCMTLLQSGISTEQKSLL